MLTPGSSGEQLFATVLSGFAALPFWSKCEQVENGGGMLHFLHIPSPKDRYNVCISSRLLFSDLVF